MKKVAIILLFFITTFSVQELKAQWYLGGGVSAWYNGNYQELQVGCSPEFGYGFNEHWSVGGSVKFNYRYRTFNDPISGEEWHTQNWYVLANPYFRYAFLPKTIGRYLWMWNWDWDILLLVL